MVVLLGMLSAASLSSAKPPTLTPFPCITDLQLQAYLAPGTPLGLGEPPEAYVLFLQASPAFCIIYESLSWACGLSSNL